MSQYFKNIYYPDYPSNNPNQRNITLAFGEKDQELYQYIKPLSSQQLRELIGHSTFASLKQAAEEEGLAINTYCLMILRKKARSLQKSSLKIYNDLASQEAHLFIDPIQATYRGGKDEPLHSWYPILEGYSPKFVEKLLLEFAPNASSVLDPFSGSGTTPLTIAKLDRQSYYCELNPLFQYLTEIKGLALSLDYSTRKHVISFLQFYADNINEYIEQVNPDNLLRESYSNIFGESLFFKDETFDKVLRLRSAIDHLACTNQLAAKFVTVAALASLVPASLLIRRGDLRFKTSEERKRYCIDFIKSVKHQLSVIVMDLERVASIKKKPLFICEDARNLINIPYIGIDAIITSPPYLNGTNYFRNTKIELWFLRCLHSKEDLSKFRLKSVTAGINDVTNNKEIDYKNEHIQEIVNTLQKVAYDRRIPKMIANYFCDMNSIFNAIKKHLTKNAVVMIDIGDSIYSGIHVPTDELLTELLIEKGFSLEYKKVLRKRMSRNGLPLQQALLVFHFKNPQAYFVKEEKELPKWIHSWKRFKAELPHQQGSFAKRNWGHPLHSLCSYQGKMKPSLAFHLVKTFVPSNGTLLDPFAGVGTIPFEASLQGIKSWAFEISPAAFNICWAKLEIPDKKACFKILDYLEEFIQNEVVSDDEIKKAEAIHFNGSLRDYFHPQTFREILLARRYFKKYPPRNCSEALVLASLLHILHGNRPYALSRRSHPITPFSPTGPIEYRALIPRLRDKVTRSLSVNYPANFVSGKILLQDATLWWPQQIDQLDAIITSPPFYDSVRFYLANWMRLWFCGWEAEDFRTKPLYFVDERQKVSFEVYEPIFRQARERLKQGGVMVLHLGKSNKCDMAEALAIVAKKWFRVADIYSENVNHCESHGIKDKGAVTSHQYLVLY
jgi:hypothetical protein